MADQFSYKPERPEDLQRAPEGAEKTDGREKQGTKEIKETSDKFTEGVSGVVEGVEFTEGNVGEKVKEGKKVAPMGGGTTAGQTQTAVFDMSQIVLPKIEVMRSQVSQQIKKEIVTLEKEAARMMRNPTNFSPFKLNAVVSKIRELKEILANLAYATMESLRGWWIKFVKGITI